MKRRSFLTWFSAGWVASCLPLAIAACTPTNTPTKTQEAASTPEPAPPRTDGFELAGTVAELDRDSQITATVLGNKVAVIRKADDPNALIALDALCTHQACKVAWKSEQKEFSCGCHGSKFAPDGSVTNGPATKPLKRYEAKIEGDKVLVKVS